MLLGLARGPFVRGRVHIDVVSWDDPHAPAQMDARLTPQQAVDRSLPTPAECDLTVVLLWGRMGTPLTEKKADGTPYLSGTEWEFENALRPTSRCCCTGDPRRCCSTRTTRTSTRSSRRSEESTPSSRVSSAKAEPFSVPPPRYADAADLLNRLRQDVEHYLSTVLARG